MIPPQELRKRTFNRAVRGYDPAEVDQYLEMLVEKYADIYNQCEIYDKKLKIVAQKIVEIQEREEDLHNKEETIGKTMMSSQEIYDKKIEEAQNTADKIVAEAEAAAEQILLDARERAQKAFVAVDKKAEEQIYSAREKSESLYLATRTRCAKLLGDFKKEISVQRDRMLMIKEATDDFAMKLSEAYKTQFDMIKNSAVYAPEIDFEKLTEARLFNMIMQEIKDDMAEIESRNGDAGYEFEKELMLLRSFDFVEDRINEYKSALSEMQPEYEDGADGYSGNRSNINDATGDEQTIAASSMDEDDVRIYSGVTDEDTKVFAGSTAAVNANEERIDHASADIAAESVSADDYDIEYEEEPISTYDSDDYEDDYSNEEAENDGDGIGDMGEVDEDGNEDEVYTHDTNNETYNSEHIEEDEGAGGIFGFFKGFGKKKKKNVNEPDDIDDIYNELDEDEVMDIFDGIEDDEEE